MLRSIIIVRVSVGLLESWPTAREQGVSQGNADVGVGCVLGEAVHVALVLVGTLLPGNTHAGRVGVFLGESA